MNKLQKLIDECKEDKSIAQPWRNYGLKHLQEALADFEKGKRVTNFKPPEGMPDYSKCTCVKDDNGDIVGRRRDCVVHGYNVS